MVGPFSTPGLTHTVGWRCCEDHVGTAIICTCVNWECTLFVVGCPINENKNERQLTAKTQRISRIYLSFAYPASSRLNYLRIYFSNSISFQGILHCDRLSFLHGPFHHPGVYLYNTSSRLTAIFFIFCFLRRL